MKFHAAWRIIFLPHIMNTKKCVHGSANSLGNTVIHFIFKFENASKKIIFVNEVKADT